MKTPLIALKPLSLAVLLGVSSIAYAEEQTYTISLDGDETYSFVLDPDDIDQDVLRQIIVDLNERGIPEGDIASQISTTMGVTLPTLSGTVHTVLSETSSSEDDGEEGTGDGESDQASGGAGTGQPNPEDVQPAAGQAEGRAAGPLTETPAATPAVASESQVNPEPFASPN